MSWWLVGVIKTVLLTGLLLVLIPAPAMAQEPPDPAAETAAKRKADPDPAADAARKAAALLDAATFMTAAPKGALSFQIENDVIGDGTDRHYTNGIRIGYVFPAEKIPGLARWLKGVLSFMGEGAEMRVMGALGHNIFTPNDIIRTDLITDQRPYAGWLYGEIGLSFLKGRVRDSAVLSLGVIGPAALAKEVQRGWHGIINVEKPEGWANQLRNEPALLLLLEREWLTRVPFFTDKIQVDFSPRAGIALGNVFDYVAVGGMARLGVHLPRDFGVPRIRPSLPGSGLFGAPQGVIDWYFFAGAEARGVARNIFLDGNTFRRSHSIAKKNLVIDAQAGFAMSFRTFGQPTRLSYAIVFRSKEFKGQQKANAFGSLSMSLQF